MTQETPNPTKEKTLRREIKFMARRLSIMTNL